MLFLDRHMNLSAKTQYNLPEPMRPQGIAISDKDNHLFLQVCPEHQQHDQNSQSLFCRQPPRADDITIHYPLCRALVLPQASHLLTERNRSYRAGPSGKLRVWSRGRFLGTCPAGSRAGAAQHRGQRRPRRAAPVRDRGGPGGAGTWKHVVRMREP